MHFTLFGDGGCICWNIVARVVMTVVEVVMWWNIDDGP